MKRRQHVTRPARPARPVMPEQLEAELATRREVEQVQRDDELARKDAQASHRIQLAGVAEREAEADADAVIAREYRHARSAGARIRLRSDMARSAEVRALRLDRLRALNLKVLVPVLLGFAAWSTTGVHDGAARLMAVRSSAATWWALWILEPVLIGAVVWITIVRARLAASGGQIARKALYLGAGFLTTSIALNLAAPTHAKDIIHTGAAMLAHAIGPVGAAVTAHLIGVVEDSIADADPWHEGEGEDKRPAPRLAEMDLSFASPATPTRAVHDAETLTEQIAETPFAASIEAWLADREPPEDGGVTAPVPDPDTDGPHDVATDHDGEDIDAETEVNRPGQISGEQARRVQHPAEGDRVKAAGQRRAVGDRNRAKVAAYLQRHPDATAEQIAQATRLSVKTAQRHRAAIRREAEA